MKLFHKIFLCFVIIFGITFQIAGYLLINFSYENAMEQGKKMAFQDFQYGRSVLQSILYAEPELFSEEESMVYSTLRNIRVPLILLGINDEYQFNTLSGGLPIDFHLNEVNDDKLSFCVFEEGEATNVFVCDYVKQGKNELYLVTQTDITAVVKEQKKMSEYFQKIYVVMLCISCPVIFLLTKLLTSSLKKLREASGRIAQGNYSQRIQTGGKDEVGELAADFNLMAEKVEEKIAELSDAARQREDFVANFAHELKTPMTSVIGYADMLYQRSLPREEVKSAAGYILNEGMRLEALSLKLMDLFVLDRQDFFLERLSVREMFEDLRQGIEPLCQKREVTLHINIGDGYIWTDFDLFKTMILNLVDNAVKADCKDLWIGGEQDGDCYWMEIKDNGRGIPPQELGRITEAFYMVDKSRSRKQHGAGLGMALVAKIIQIHDAKLDIKSDGKTGTQIRMTFCPAERDKDEQNI